jgi:hypothetical protein
MPHGAIVLITIMLLATIAMFHTTIFSINIILKLKME